ncbi:methyltransferase domain-containing protein [Lineolata rhizophorae]|uniref:Methyltransferase domain-containing protein n=1 Tax=Lineolata rhizophorae TaxID=578093 RepID=A0A6A6NUZ7_9PEZI|nr:methyltransferase domain-containing protein [Lineolata rhizophorae]
MPPPLTPLPLPPGWTDADVFVDSLLAFGTSSLLLRTLCGGVHILDFFTRSPSLYETVLPAEWHAWLDEHDVMDLLDLLMREDLGPFDGRGSAGEDHDTGVENAETRTWRGGAVPPLSLIEYIKDIRRHTLRRDGAAIRSPGQRVGGNSNDNNINEGNSVNKHPPLPRNVAVGMTLKKQHEVSHFASYVASLQRTIADMRPPCLPSSTLITHLVDFGSGQNYLGRALAGAPYNAHVIAVESKPHNIQGAKNMDVLAKLVPKQGVRRNKKEWRAQVLAAKEEASRAGKSRREAKRVSEMSEKAREKEKGVEGKGTIQYVQHRIADGDLGAVIEQIESMDRLVVDSKTLPEDSKRNPDPEGADPSLMVISLHSCGNLSHHGLRTITTNKAVTAVALVGCCYNLLTERLGPPSYKLPQLRSNHPRLEKTANAHDPHGFPMSKRFEEYDCTDGEKGVRLNITARMMAVQAPQNWGREDSRRFFTRHFYRALLQRVFLDRGIVRAPEAADDVVGGSISTANARQESHDGLVNTPITIGTLSKSAYASFAAYVHAASVKLSTPGGPSPDTSPSTSGTEISRAAFFRARMPPEAFAPGAPGWAEMEEYEERYRRRKHELEVVWSLMAFSAGVVEAMVVVDRWVWLCEQECVGKGRAWVEAVWGFGVSPRNLVVVGVKK